MLTLLAAIAEFEKGIMLERQREGIAIAKEDGKYKGRKPTEKTKLLQVQTLIESGISISKAVSEVGTADALITKRLQKVAFSFYFSLATFFSETLLRPPFEKFTELKQNQALPQMDCTQYLNERLEQLEKRLAHINKLAAEDALPDATITETGLKITPIETSVPKNAKPFVDKATTLLPRVKFTELLLEVDQWTNFTEHFTHLKSNEMAEDKTLLLTAILANGINLGLSKMSESCLGVTYAKLSWLQDWHIRDETYSAALAVLTNAQLKQPFAAHWGDGTTSSSDGQPFQTTNGAKGKGQINPKNGSEPNRQLYTHVSDQYSPFSSRIMDAIK